MSDTESSAKGFGTFSGVVVPNVTMMFGVILFMRLGLIVGYMGIVKFALILSMGLGVMVITSFSIAAIVTNMQVGSGGAYYLISRSLGLEIGGAVGFALILSQIISLSLCTTGFAYSLTSLFPNLSVEWVEIATLLILLLLSGSSANIALKAQSIIAVILLVAIGSIFLGFSPVVMEPTPFYLGGLRFWEAFALFYPAMTGIEAGMALSGNLRNPSKSLAWGNLISLIFVAAVYFAIGFVLWLNVPGEDLRSTPFILLKDTLFPSLIYLGIWCATLSSAIGNMLGAPRMMQMISEDGIIPSLFSKTYGTHKEPRISIAAIFLIAIFVVFFTTIDEIIPILTMICLLTYGTLNLVAGFAELIHAASWRPAMRCSWQVSLLGGFSCLFFMFMIDPSWTFISLGAVSLLYLLIRSRSLEGSFEDIRENILFYFSRKALYRLAETEDTAANWTPQILLISKAPTQHEQMIFLANAITWRSGILTVASIIPPYWETPDQIDRIKQRIQDWLRAHSISSLVEVQAYEHFSEGAVSLIKSYGIGSFQPNTIMLSVTKHLEENLDELIETLETARTYEKNILLYYDDPNVHTKLLQRISSKRKQIDLWWDSSHCASFELILSYILAMRTSPYWAHRTVTLRATASDLAAKKHLEEHLKQMFYKLRIRVKVKIVVESNRSIEECVASYSKKAHLIFFPLKPHTDFENPLEFKDYLHKVAKNLPDEIPSLLATCYDSLDHKEVYAD